MVVFYFAVFARVWLTFWTPRDYISLPPIIYAAVNVSTGSLILTAFHRFFVFDLARSSVTVPLVVALPHTVVHASCPGGRVCSFLALPADGRRNNFKPSECHAPMYRDHRDCCAHVSRLYTATPSMNLVCFLPPGVDLPGATVLLLDRPNADHPGGAGSLC